MIIEGTQYRPEALLILGASIVREVYAGDESDPGRIVVGYEVEPEIELSGYAAAEAEWLSTLKAGLRAAVDATAEAERLKYITGGAGQAMTYQRKLEEARAADAEVAPDPLDYPLLAASVGIDGATVADVADLVLAMDAQWSTIGAAIEATRLGAKKAITEAVDEAVARAAFAALSWPQA